MKQQRITGKISTPETHGSGRFLYFLDKVETLFEAAAKQRNPADWLYRNNLRTPFFMLEGLAKLYAELHNTKRFTKLKERFKQVEDLLGAIDYYDAFIKMLDKSPKITPAVMRYLKAGRHSSIVALQEHLAAKQWPDIHNGRIAKIRRKLVDAEWQDSASEVEGIGQAYADAIEGIRTFTGDGGCTFDDVETGVHELRRKLRWLSIYPQALRGAIQLKATAKKPSKALLKYQTTATLNSPFNTMPPAGDLQHILYLDRNGFLALSWVIAALGELKDSGLQVLMLTDALQHAEKLAPEAALKKAYTLLGRKQPRLEQLLQDAGSICQTFFKDGILTSLVVK